jgi:methionyl-tRNA formyltransferase
MSALPHPRIAFFGTPEHAVWVLDELLQAGITPDLIVCAPDKPAGRKLILTPPAVKEWALAHNIPVSQPASLRDPALIPEITTKEWDLFIVAAYNIILPKWVIDTAHHGVLNVHPSLLPKYRGPSPVRSTLIADDKTAVGVTIMLLDEKIDHGPIVAQKSITPPSWPILGRTLDELLFREGGQLLAQILPEWLRGTHTATPQDDTQATYCKKFLKADGELDRTKDDYTQYLQYCAMDGWPGTFFFHERIQKNGEHTRTRIKITKAEYEQGTFRILRVIPEGKKEISYTDFLAQHN